jgi:hypothetical protein
MRGFIEPKHVHSVAGPESGQPGFEARGITERGQVSPRPDERSLHGVFGEIGVAKHQSGGSIEAVDVPPNQRLERRRLAGLRRDDQARFDGTGRVGAAHGDKA